MISEELYKKCITDLVKQQEYIDGLHALGIDIDYPSPIFNLEDDLVAILNIITNDSNEEDCSDISYFLYELDCGKKWKPGMIIDSDGRDIKLETVDDLWKEVEKRLNKC